MNYIKYTDSISAVDYLMLRKAVGFKELSARQAEAALKNKAFLIVATDDDRTVGMTRLIADGAYIAVIVDVIVLPEYQGRGIGRAMMDKTMDFIKSSITDDEQIAVYLIAAKDKEGFYEKFGFIKRPDETYGAGMSQWISKQA